MDDEMRADRVQSGGSESTNDSGSLDPLSDEAAINVQALFGPVLSETLPVCAYVAFGLSSDKLRVLGRVVAQAALVSGDHVPLIVTDCATFSMLRDTGLAIEYVPDQSVWQSHRRDVAWTTFRSDRLRQLVKIHQPARVVYVWGDRIPELADLLAFDYFGDGTTGIPARRGGAAWMAETIEVGGVRSLARAVVLVAALGGRRLVRSGRRLAKRWIDPES